MPDRVADDLLLFIRQNKGTLSKKRREGEFAPLKGDEIERIEAIVQETFDGFDEIPGEEDLRLLPPVQSLRLRRTEQP